MVLDKLYEELGVTEKFDKIAVSALVYETLSDNKCGLTDDNRQAVKERLIDGVCSMYEFCVMSLASTWSNDLASLLQEHIGFSGNIFKDHIWKFITDNEVYPGVRMSS